MPDNLFRKKLLILGFLVFMVFFAPFAFASETNGTIDETFKYAWGENIGWLNFGCNDCNVQVGDAGLSGYVWSKEYGWINLNPSTSGVKNNGEGLLSGYAWGLNLGWINFDGVTINLLGEFSGYATIKNDNSRINFNCVGTTNSCSEADFKVKTDWRPGSVRHYSSSGYYVSRTQILPPVAAIPVVSVVDNISEVVSSLYNSISDLFKSKEKIPKTNILVQVPKITPLSLNGQWKLLSSKSIQTFVFAPLPSEIRTLASKFPELDRTLKSVGVERFSDLNKLNGITLNISGLTSILNTTIKNVGLEKLTNIGKLNGVALNVPGLSNTNGQIMNSVGTGKIALIKGLPLANFSLTAKKNLPAEFVFARADNELVDLNVTLSIKETGEVTQQIASLPGKILKLVIKPIGPAKSVTGYFIFESATPRVSINSNQIFRESLTASALFSMNDLVESVPSIPIEKKLVLSSFEYTDPDYDGIYTADVASPVTPGEYQIMTIINYIDPNLGTRQIRMTTVIDPEGYVYEKNNGKETRIPSAIVSLYSLNIATKKYELWKASDYQQENPQITDIRGIYSFLVPEGSYYFQVEASGYESYQGKVFVAMEGGGIHQNIEMKSNSGFLYNFDWKTALLFVVLLLLVYNLFKDKLSKFLNKHDSQ